MNSATSAALAAARQLAQRLCFGTLVAMLVAACTGEIEAPPASVGLAPPSGLRALTPAQYRESVRAVLGPDVPVDAVGPWTDSLASARGGVASRTMLQYRAQAGAATRWAFESAERRAQIAGCEPAAIESDPCLRDVLSRLGRRAFRRTLTSEELDRYVALATHLGAADPWRGLAMAVSGMLQSPYFLYRVELAEERVERSGVRAYRGAELASRLSYFLWGAPPDEELLDAAERGELSDRARLREIVGAMLADPRAVRGRENMFDELFHGASIEGLSKDELLFPEFDAELARTMRAQLARTAAAAAGRGDLSTLFTTRTTFVNDDLAPLYGLPPSFGSELSEVVLSEDGPRAGVLTLPGFLALGAHPGKTSPALRGLFVRKVLLCQEIPPPPPGVVTTLPQNLDGRLVTTRELVARHEEDPSCAACHARMDPIGLGLERFDAIGRFRVTENELPIDPSGELDGIAFADAEGLGSALAQHPDLSSCLTRTFFAQAAGRTLDRDSRYAAEVEGAVGDGPAELDEILVAIVTSDLFVHARNP